MTAIRWGFFGAIILGLAAPTYAMGRKHGYVSTGQEDIQPVKRGSAANPNPAFAPPTFDSYRPRAAAPPVAPPVKTYSSKAAQIPAPTNDGLPAPGGAPIPDQPAAPPKAVPTAPTAADAGVPALPDYSSDSQKQDMPAVPAPAPSPTTKY